MNDRGLLGKAVQRRVRRYVFLVFFYLIFGALSVCAGVGLFYFLWIEFRTDESEAIAQLFEISVTLIATGIGGFLLKEVLSFRNKIGEGNEWLDLHAEAIGPPPHKLLPEIEGKILDWLGG